MKHRMKQLVILCLAVAALSGCSIGTLESTIGTDLSAIAFDQNVPAVANDDLLIRNAILLSPERDEPVYNMDVLVQDGYIQEIAEQIENSAGT